tara:strand:+ start:2648 stop:3370 length:723 start_codon:yes stop_codon:yes gene_type:complete
MTPNFITLNNQTHRHLKIRNFTDYAHVKNEHLAPLAIHEFVRMSGSLPIIFVKSPNDENFQAVTMMGLRPGENLVVKGGGWNAVYIPGSVITYPFGLARVPAGEEGQEDRFVITIDENSPLVNEEDGTPLFDEDGNATEFLENCRKGLMTHFNHIQSSHEITRYLAEKDLLMENALTVTLEEGQEPMRIGGVFVVNEEKLNNMPAEEFEDLRQRGLLPALYAQLASLHQVHRLVNMARSA